MNIFIEDYILKNNKLTITFIYVIDPEAELLKEVYTWRMPPKEVLDQHPYYIDNYKNIDIVTDYNYSELNSEYLEEQIRNSPILSEFIRDNTVPGEDTENINIFDSIESLLSYTKNKKEEIQNDAIEDANIKLDNNQAEVLAVEPKLENQINESETEPDLNE